MSLLVFVLLTYVAFLIIGGFIGFFIAGSLISLTLSLIFGFAILGCVYKIARGSQLGLFGAILLVLLLTVVFLFRFLKTFAFIPPGMLALVSLGVLIYLFTRKRSKPSGTS